MGGRVLMQGSITRVLLVAMAMAGIKFAAFQLGFDITWIEAGILAGISVFVGWIFFSS